MQLTTRQQINKLHEQLITHVSLNEVRIFGYDHYPAVYQLPTSTSLADMLWAVIDAAQAAGDFNPVLELLKYHHRTAYQRFMAWLEETVAVATPPASPPPPSRPVRPGKPGLPPAQFAELRAILQALPAFESLEPQTRRDMLVMCEVDRFFDNDPRFYNLGTSQFISRLYATLSRKRVAVEGGSRSALALFLENLLYFGLDDLSQEDQQFVEGLIRLLDAQQPPPSISDRLKEIQRRLADSRR